MRKVECFSERQVLNRKPCLAESKRKAFKTRKMVVPSYRINEHGLTECVPICEDEVLRPTEEGRNYEIAQGLFGHLPETLEQVNMYDQMEAAERITTTAVRRFGNLSKQKEELQSKLNDEV